MRAARSEPCDNKVTTSRELRTSFSKPAHLHRWPIRPAAEMEEEGAAKEALHSKQTPSDSAHESVALPPRPLARALARATAAASEEAACLKVTSPPLAAQGLVLAAPLPHMASAITQSGPGNSAGSTTPKSLQWAWCSALAGRHPTASSQGCTSRLAPGLSRSHSSRKHLPICAPAALGGSRRTRQP